MVLVAMLLASLARRAGAPYPVFLALGGVCLAFLPGAPSFSLPPDLALAIFIAPVLLATASRHIKLIVCETRGSAMPGDINRGSSPTVRESFSLMTRYSRPSAAPFPNSRRSSTRSFNFQLVTRISMQTFGKAVAIVQHQQSSKQLSHSTKATRSITSRVTRLTGLISVWSNSIDDIITRCQP